jgi:hypothetical protein
MAIRSYTGRNKSYSRDGNRNVNIAAANAGSKGLGGGLLLGFSTCDPKIAGDPVTYIAPLHRLKGTYQVGNKLNFHFEPIIGTQSGGVDVITLVIDPEFMTEVWISISNILGGRMAGDTFVWVQNACAPSPNSQTAQVIPGVTSMGIVIDGIIPPG